MAFSGGCAFAEEDYGVLQPDLGSMTGYFPGSDHAVECALEVNRGAIWYWDSPTLKRSVHLYFADLAALRTTRGL